MRLKIIQLGLLLTLNCTSNVLHREAVLSLEDYSSKINIVHNSFPGKQEELIEKWIEDNHPDKPFFIRIPYGTDAGTTFDGKVIKSATIFVVNPHKKSGMLWWKKSQVYSFKEPDWTHFIIDAKPLTDTDNEKLKLLLQ